MLFVDMYTLNPILCVHIMDMKLLLFLLEFQSVRAVLAVCYLLDDTYTLSIVLSRPLTFIKYITMKLNISSLNQDGVVIIIQCTCPPQSYIPLKNIKTKPLQVFQGLVDDKRVMIRDQASMPSV